MTRRRLHIDCPKLIEHPHWNPSKQMICDLEGSWKVMVPVLPRLARQPASTLPPKSDIVFCILYLCVSICTFHYYLLIVGSCAPRCGTASNGFVFTKNNLGPWVPQEPPSRGHWVSPVGFQNHPGHLSGQALLHEVAEGGGASITQ